MTTTFDLRGELGLGTTPAINPQQKRFETYGMLENPFPPANKTSGNPRSASTIDSKIASHIKAFLGAKTSEVVVITGSQGLGKTNVLEYYQRELSNLLQEQGKIYFVRYYTDPQPDFGSVVTRIFQELGDEHLKSLARATRELSHDDKQTALGLVATPDLRIALRRLFKHQDEDSKLAELSKLLLEYLMGLRLYKKHIDELGLQQRLDTTESKTQALHDIVFVSHHLGVLQGIFLFLDEFEKIGGLATQLKIRYLSAVRALLDALPQYLFLMLAMTPEAHARYARDLPALGGRLQDELRLELLDNEDDAIKLASFYVAQAREDAEKDPATLGKPWSQGKAEIVEEEVLRQIFQQELKRSREKQVRGGVTPRDFLNALHDHARRVLVQLND